MSARLVLVALLLVPALHDVAAQTGVDWARGNCVAEDGPRTQLALLRAGTDSAPIFPVGSPVAREFARDLERLAPVPTDARIYVAPPAPGPAGRALGARWWSLGRQVYPWFEHADSTSGQFAVLLRIAFTSGITGYVVQLPPIDNGAVRDLWTYDALRQCFHLPVPVASGWGDAGETALQERWLLDLNGDGVRDLVSHGRSTSIADSAGAVEHVTDEVWVRLWTPAGFAARQVVPADQYVWARGPRPPGRPR